MVTRIGLLADRLESTSTIDMRGGRDLVAFAGFDGIRQGHERRRVRLLEPVGGSFFENRRSKRSEDLAVFDAAIQDFLHFRTAWIGDNAAIPERSRPPFGSPL